MTQLTVGHHEQASEECEQVLVHLPVSKSLRCAARKERRLAEDSRAGEAVACVYSSSVIADITHSAQFLPVKMILEVISDKKS